MLAIPELVEYLLVCQWLREAGGAPLQDVWVVELFSFRVQVALRLVAPCPLLQGDLTEEKTCLYPFGSLTSGASYRPSCPLRRSWAPYLGATLRLHAAC